MPKYRVTVEFSGPKIYEVEAESMDAVHQKFNSHGTFEYTHNEISDLVHETISDISLQNDVYVASNIPELIDLLRDAQSDGVLKTKIIINKCGSIIELRQE